LEKRYFEWKAFTTWKYNDKFKFKKKFTHLYLMKKEKIKPDKNQLKFISPSSIEILIRRALLLINLNISDQKIKWW
jgi:hypothetical protein